MRDTALAFLLTASVIGCGGRESAAPLPAAPSGTISPQVSAYLEQLIGLMQANSINRKIIDWSRFRVEVLAAAGAAQTVPDAYDAVRVALRLLADGHSFYRTTGGTVIFVPLRTCVSGAGASRPTLPTSIAYVRVGSFSGSVAEAAAFANRIQNDIIAEDREGIAGWMVDLRGNGGGNMWPMIAGLGAVIGEDVLGFFIDPDGVESMGIPRRRILAQRRSAATHRRAVPAPPRPSPSSRADRQCRRKLR